MKVYGCMDGFSVRFEKGGSAAHNGDDIRIVQTIKIHLGISSMKSSLIYLFRMVYIKL